MNDLKVNYLFIDFMCLFLFFFLTYMYFQNSIANKY